MKSSLKIRWLIVGCVWLATVGLTYWNINKIEDVASVRDTNERLRKEMLFQRRNVEKLKRVTGTHQALFLPVESVALGIVSVKSHLHSLAAAFDLAQVHIRDEMTQATEERVPLNFSARGSFEKAVAFLAVLQKYPHLPTIQTDIKAVNDKGEMEMTVALHFQYSIVESAQMKADPLQATNRQPNQGANPI